MQRVIVVKLGIEYNKGNGHSSAMIGRGLELATVSVFACSIVIPLPASPIVLMSSIALVELTACACGIRSG